MCVRTAVLSVLSFVFYKVLEYKQCCQILQYGYTTKTPTHHTHLPTPLHPRNTRYDPPTPSLPFQPPSYTPPNQTTVIVAATAAAIPAFANYFFFPPPLPFFNFFTSLATASSALALSASSFTFNSFICFSARVSLSFDAAMTVGLAPSASAPT